MRSLAIVCALLSTGCASLPSPRTQSMSAPARHPPATLERRWLMPLPQEEVTLLDTRTLQAVRELNDTQALNQNGNGRDVKVGMWVGIGVGAAVGIHIVNEAIDDVVDDFTNDAADNFLACFFDLFFGGDCDDDD